MMEESQHSGLFYSETSIGIKKEDSSTTLFPVDLTTDFVFNPSTKELPASLEMIQDSLLCAEKNDRKLFIRTSSPLVLILVPLLLSFRDRVEVIIECEKKDFEICENDFLNDTSENIAKTKRFKELLDAARILTKHEIYVSFSTKVKADK